MATSQSLPATLLAVATVAAVGTLVLAAADIGSVLAWAHVPIPLVIAAGAANEAAKAIRRGEGKSATALLGWCVMANAFVALLAGLLAGEVV